MADGYQQNAFQPSGFQGTGVEPVIIPGGFLPNYSRLIRNRRLLNEDEALILLLSAYYVRDDYELTRKVN